MANKGFLSSKQASLVDALTEFEKRRVNICELILYVPEVLLLLLLLSELLTIYIFVSTQFKRKGTDFVVDKRADI